MIGLKPKNWELVSWMNTPTMVEERQLIGKCTENRLLNNAHIKDSGTSPEVVGVNWRSSMSELSTPPHHPPLPHSLSLDEVIGVKHGCVKTVFWAEKRHFPCTCRFCERCAGQERHILLVETWNSFVREFIEVVVQWFLYVCFCSFALLLLVNESYSQNAYEFHKFSLSSIFLKCCLPPHFSVLM